ncbi:hypothetical protein EV702DRAFT_1049302 [Suillus placidus]|uniref:Uncharacterized protein n=1 Tax=Suillus placidus TaxID=48579 RepID=A0A9P6ZLP0_9AGAM|nr:hypothetical protein EV702DRAFT_1049302 [Suillus placidus]
MPSDGTAHSAIHFKLCNGPICWSALFLVLKLARCGDGEMRERFTAAFGDQKWSVMAGGIANITDNACLGAMGDRTSALRLIPPNAVWSDRGEEESPTLLE